MALADTTTCKACGAPIVQIGGGHRQRSYSNDSCRQANFRMKQEEKHQEAIRQRWQDFMPETQTYLDWIMQHSGEDLAQGIATVIKSELGHLAEEQEKGKEGLRDKQVSRVEKLKARISQLEQELSQAQRPLIDAALATEAKKRIEELEQELALSQQNVVLCQEKLAQTGSHIQKLERQVEIQKERLAQSYQQPNQTKRVAELEQELAQANQGLDDVQKRFRQYVHMTNEKLSDLAGEVARYRQVVDLSDRRRLELQLYDIGDQIGYRQFIPADHLLAVGHGVEYWRAFAESATDEELAQAVVRVKYYAENLLWLDNQDELKRARQRIRELERQMKANGTHLACPD